MVNMLCYFLFLAFSKCLHEQKRSSHPGTCCFANAPSSPQRTAVIVYAQQCHFVPAFQMRYLKMLNQPLQFISRLNSHFALAKLIYLNAVCWARCILNCAVLHIWKRQPWVHSVCRSASKCIYANNPVQ